LARREVDVEASYQPETKTIQATVAAHEDITPGIFHKLTGAFSSRGLEILSAEIITLPGGLVLDRFQVVDPDYAGCPPAERFDEIRRTLEASLGNDGQGPPTFRRTWQVRAAGESRPRVARTQVRVDNGTSHDCTILDIFAADRPGLLYEIARTLFELGLSVKRAKIGTVMDQVLDVFYVTDQEGRKIEDRFRHQEIRGRLLKVILSQDEAGEGR
jgi:[protein-PII] uridylyltransferase